MEQWSEGPSAFFTPGWGVCKFGATNPNFMKSSRHQQTIPQLLTFLNTVIPSDQYDPSNSLESALVLQDHVVSWESVSLRQGSRSTAKVRSALKTLGSLLTRVFDSYDLPHRAYDAKIYPRQSSNGSTVIVYGHDHGVRVVWRGGRSFKATHQAPEKKSNGTADSSVMIIDSDDEDSAPPVSQAEFEEEEQSQVDSEQQYPEILRQIDVPLGTKALRLAVCSNAVSLVNTESPSSLLTSHIIIAATCADCSTRVITLPLTPPSPENKQLSAWGVQTLKLFGHQDVASGVAITLASPVSKSTSRSSSRGKSPERADESTKNDWHILVATHSPEASGLLLIYSLPIVKNKNSKYHLSTLEAAPAQKLYLRSPAHKVAFNPSSPQAPRHSHLLVSFSEGPVKLYSCAPEKSPSTSSRRRESGASADPPATSGGWLMTLHPGFQANGKRKTVLDADWVLGGKAVMALFLDGEWGVWDIEGAGPGNATNNLLRNQNTIQGVTGGSTAVFSTSGWLPNSQSTVKSQATPATEAKPNLAPMTPSTRRIREDTFFKQNNPSGSLTSSKGGISVSGIENTSSDMNGDEAVLFWHGDQLYALSSLLSFWKSNTKSTGIFENSHRRKVNPIQDVKLLGAKVQAAQIFSSSEVTLKQARQPDILLLTEHRLILVSATKDAEQVRTTATAFSKPALQNKNSLFGANGAGATNGDADDSQMDIDDINRSLDMMASARGGNSLFSNGFGGSGLGAKNRGFA